MLLLLCLFSTNIASSDNTAVSSGEFLINCGSTGASAARNGRKWLGDVHKFSSSVDVKGSSTMSRVIHQKLTSDPVPYKTARLSRSQFSYTLRMNAGQKIIRLHFNPAPYKGFKQYKDLFDVEAGPFTLLSNFSASLAAHALSVHSFVKEFCINIEENQLLNLIFSPANSQLRDTYAFINGIEIISVPASRSYFHVEDAIVQLVGKSPIHIDSSTALEIIRRMNTKQESVSLSTGDIGDRWQMWGSLPEHGGNKANNITWKIPVDVGFRYVVRLHFSKLGFKIAEIGGFIYEVLINGKIATTSSDTLDEIDEESIECSRDYTVVMKGSKQEGKRDLLITLRSHEEFLDGHGLLKGFEILKLSNPDNSLATPNPMHIVNVSSYQSFQILPRVLGHKYSILNGAIILLVILNLISHMLWIIQEARAAEEENMPSPKVGRLCRRFSLAEIQLATRNFNRGQLIGRGGFGKVYKGIIDNGQQTVAIKRLKPDSSQGTREFLTEIETLTELRHINLVSLIGYCNECKEMILIYEHMASGTLADHLFKLVRYDDSIPPLTWKQRLNICIGAGRGLDYLHTGHSIIHRDVKASNILLDEDFTAKVADFGLAKTLNRSKLRQSYVSTKVRGTIGYFDPAYYTTGKLTRKSDTYAFGVVLLEVLCGRRAIDRGFLPGEQILCKWALERISNGKADQIVDSYLNGEISDDSLKAFVGIATMCLHDEPQKRPTMAEVVLQLQSALELQEMKAKSVKSDLMSYKQTVPAIPFNELKHMIRHFHKIVLNDGAFLHGVLKSGQAAAFRVVKHKKHTDREFHKQVLKMSSLKHENVAELLGYSMHGALRILVYEHASDGSLHDILHGGRGGRPVLSWIHRVKIAVGVAEGLNYLHGIDYIYRGLTSSNILMFNDFEVAKITNFHFPTILVEDECYDLDPDYYFPGYHPRDHGYGYSVDCNRTAKTDVYNFGVVLLELLTGRAPFDKLGGWGPLPLAKWAKPYLSEDTVNWCIDSRLNGEYPQEGVAKVAAVAASCLYDADSRPDMCHIVKTLQPLLDADSRPDMCHIVKTLQPLLDAVVRQRPPV